MQALIHHRRKKNYQSVLYREEKKWGQAKYLPKLKRGFSFLYLVPKYTWVGGKLYPPPTTIRRRGILPWFQGVVNIFRRLGADFGRGAGLRTQPSAAPCICIPLPLFYPFHPKPQNPSSSKYTALNVFQLTIPWGKATAYEMEISSYCTVKIILLKLLLASDMKKNTLIKLESIDKKKISIEI